MPAVLMARNTSEKPPTLYVNVTKRTLSGMYTHHEH